MVPKTLTQLMTINRTMNNPTRQRFFRNRLFGFGDMSPHYIFSEVLNKYEIFGGGLFSLSLTHPQQMIDLNNQLKLNNFKKLKIHLSYINKWRKLMLRNTNCWQHNFIDAILLRLSKLYVLTIFKISM